MKQKLMIFGLLILSLSCSKDSVENDPRFTGSWVAYYELEDSNTSAHQYNFKADGTYEEASMVLDSETLEIIGYWTYATGTFVTEDNRLTINREKFYEAKDPWTYKAKEDLELTGKEFSYGLGYQFKTEDKLTLYPDCPISSQCPGPIEYDKMYMLRPF